MDEHERTASSDGGFSLIEVVVAMMLLALLAVMTLPLFLTRLRVSSANGSTTTASAAVSAALEQARAVVAAAPNSACSALQTFATHTVPTLGFEDTHQRAVTMSMSSPSCSNTPKAVTVTVSATVPAPSCNAATSPNPCVFSASTIIFVRS